MSTGTTVGRVASYVHGDGRIGVLIHAACETDFLARTSEFETFLHELCLQLVACPAADVATFLEQPWIKDDSKKVAWLVGSMAHAGKEDVVVVDIHRIETNDTVFKHRMLGLK